MTDKKDNRTNPKEVGRDALQILRDCVSPESLEKLKQGLRDRIKYLQEKNKKKPEQLKSEQLTNLAEEYLKKGGEVSIYSLCLKHHVSFRRLSKEIRRLLGEHE